MIDDWIPTAWRLESSEGVIRISEYVGIPGSPMGYLVERDGDDPHRVCNIDVLWDGEWIEYVGDAPRFRTFDRAQRAVDEYLRRSDALRGLAPRCAFTWMPVPARVFQTTVRCRLTAGHEGEFTGDHDVYHEGLLDDQIVRAPAFSGP